MQKTCVTATQQLELVRRGALVYRWIGEEAKKEEGEFKKLGPTSVIGNSFLGRYIVRSTPDVLSSMVPLTSILVISNCCVAVTHVFCTIVHYLGG